MFSTPLWTEHEVSRFLNVSVAALRRWRTEHRGPRFIKVASALGSRGGLVRYRRESVEEFLSEQATGGGGAGR